MTKENTEKIKEAVIVEEKIQEKKAEKNEKKENKVVKEKKPLMKDRKSDFLALEYIFALGASLVSIISLVSGLHYLAGSWGSGFYSSYVGFFFAASALLSAIFAMIFFKRVTNSVKERKDFTKRLVYKVPTYAAFAIAFLIGVNYIIGISAILLAAIFGEIALSVGMFLAILASILIICSSVWHFREIVLGRNRSGSLSLKLVISAVVLMFFSFIASIDKMYSNNSVNETRRSYDRNYDYDYDTDFRMR